MTFVQTLARTETRPAAYGSPEQDVALTAIGQLMPSWVAYRHAQPARAAVSYNSNHYAIPS